MKFSPRLAALAAVLALPLGAALVSAALPDGPQPAAPAEVRIGGTGRDLNAPERPAAGQSIPTPPSQEPAAPPPTNQPAPEAPPQIKTQVVPPAPPVVNSDDGGGDDGGGDGDDGGGEG